MSKIFVKCQKNKKLKAVEFDLNIQDIEVPHGTMTKIAKNIGKYLFFQIKIYSFLFL